MLFSLGLFLICGAFAGVLAGLFGVGGGLIIVPILVYAFSFLGVAPEHIHHLALGTSLATIMITSLASSRAHYKKDALNVDLLKKITPGILFGTFFGGIIATHMPIFVLKCFFVVFVYYVSLQMFLKIKPKPTRQLPNTAGTIGVGSVIGLVSSFVGIGGGTLSVPFATYCNEPMHRAIGTSAAIGFPIAVSGTLGYIYAGWNVPNLPEFAIGYVHGIAFLGIACASFFTAPLGAKLSHSMPVDTLKRYFSIFLFFIGSKMLYDVITNYVLN